MASKTQERMSITLVLMVMVWGGAQAQSNTCTNTLMGLSSCLNYVTGNLGRAEKVELPKQKASKSPRGFDDLLPGFGSDGPASGSRSNSEPVPVLVRKETSNTMDDPFVVLESASPPITSSQVHSFIDPLETVHKINIPVVSCCSQLSNVVQSQPRCLCSLLNGSAPNIGVTINQTLAISLPGACKVQTPPLNLCNGVANGPASGPANGPVSGPTSSVSSPNAEPTTETPEIEAPTAISTPSVPSGSGSGSKSTPATNNNTSNGSNFGAPSYFLLFVLFFGMKF
ncbi:hypothetical protein LXL04_018795 [Taraxacum kok-saghyz]